MPEDESEEKVVDSSETTHMQLLDLLVPGQPYRPRRRFDNIDTDKPIKHISDTVDNIKDSVAETISCCKHSVADSISCCKHSVGDTISCCKHSISDTLTSAVPFQGTTGSGGDASTLIWAIIAVLIVLAICLWFALSYHRRLSVR